ncbi:DNA-directed RNA polymerase subunit delta [Candidatus Phytoplasma rubi]|uniref:RNAP delta factor n=1 Tax=Candidatus Phytoplasma rubi TaxID=399025 RepID=A0ABY7BUR0_9MOLU|nr:DNA-directed RNA polymerase subunit delta [Candidatus Phytoplasma rubi]WAN63667.1 DNA-directed RNA polymerase subunit delta [Candidatus Phytoplasma rubi]
MEKNNKNIDSSSAMIDISYQILSQNKKPMNIQQLIEEVFKIKKLDINNKEICIQLYLDIVLSGCFVFCGDDLWNIKKNNLNFWDKDFFINPNEQKIEIKKDLEKEILDFNEFDLKPKSNEENDEYEEEKLNDIPLDNLDINDEKEELEINEEEIDDIEKDKNNEEDDEYINDYEEYFYK